jgi:pyrroline-5-carboxylate reductase
MMKDDIKRGPQRQFIIKTKSGVNVMSKTGFIGYGHMGSIMLKALLDAKVIPQNKVILTNRTIEKLNDFSNKYPKVEIAKSVPELAAKCDRVFICTSTGAVKSVLEELARSLAANSHVITITGNIEIKCVESIFSGRISKIMPTQIAEVGEGVTLVCHNKKALPEDKEFLRTAFGKIGQVMEIPESQFSIGSELTSCAPAFYAAICRNFAEVAKRHSALSIEEAKALVIPTLFGTAKLLKERQVDPAELITRVATKGGISEEGVKILDRELPHIFEEMLKVTMDKREKIKKDQREQYGVY